MTGQVTQDGCQTTLEMIFVADESLTFDLDWAQITRKASTLIIAQLKGGYRSQ